MPADSEVLGLSTAELTPDPRNARPQASNRGRLARPETHAQPLSSLAGDTAGSAWLAPLGAMNTLADGWATAMQLAAFAFAPPQTRNEAPPFRSAEGDNRFRDPLWRTQPRDLLVQAQLGAEQFWKTASSPLAGSRNAGLALTSFAVDQAIRAVSPSNFSWSNPAAVTAMRRTAGKSVVDGAWNWFGDSLSLLAGRDPLDERRFSPGGEIAATPGTVVFRNALMELIQYSPSTPKVRVEPVLIIPAWIMKFYILDLSPKESLIRYLVDQGFTVFCVSWKNPTATDRNLELDDYRSAGVMDAMDVVSDVVPGAKIHGVGYCAGGTILSIAAAAMARDEDDRLGSLTLFAAMTDFEDPGEISTFLLEPQVTVLESVMDAQGYLDPAQMAFAFHALRADDLVWAPYIRRYLLGERRPGTQFDMWFHDGTRLPALMHSQYLRWLYLENRLAGGTLDAGGGLVNLRDVEAPLFAVGAERDHIAPWRSVFRAADLVSSESTLVLSGGGHNSAIVSPPGKSHAFYRIHSPDAAESRDERDSRMTHAPPTPGSWWPAWLRWLETHSSAGWVQPPAMGSRDRVRSRLDPAPGQYVLER